MEHAVATPYRSAAGPPVPDSVADTGLTPEAITDLLLKILYVQGARTGNQLMDVICLPFPIVDDRLLDLQQRRFVEVRGTVGAGREGYTFDLTSGGRERAREAMESSQYAGAAPVPLSMYREWLERESILGVHVTKSRIREGFPDMVLDEHMFGLLGPAINSASSLFLYGEPGNGKTMIAETIARLLGGDGGIWVPYAVELDGQIIIVYDPVHHRRIEEAGQSDAEPGSVESLLLRRTGGADRRFVRIRRPVVITGGELTLEQLDLQYDASTKMYQAPFQVKANGGVLIIDDFGRQRVPPGQLLNRWIVPLEKRRDYLTMHTGVKFPVPFDTLVIFATNLDPNDLVDEAFLRRIHYKIRVPGPGRQSFEEIFRRVCGDRGIPYDAAAVQFIYSKYYEGHGIEPRGCHPRDIADHILDFARYHERDPRLDSDLVDEACESYFLIMAADAMKQAAGPGIHGLHG